MSTATAQTSPLPVYAERVGWGLYLALLGAAVLAHLDRTGVPFLPLWLTISTLFSVVILFILVILFALLADKGYTDAVRNSGSGFLALGGGLVFTVLLLL
ncbi:MAG: hypothetical protein HGA76_01650, partial [Candidatus Firestonebacteria bacterium]|nr:hypothetical protein [Candidatus Firestonebacteria bacterium]